jgi:formylglycine-generating enzyme
MLTIPINRLSLLLYVNLVFHYSAYADEKTDGYEAILIKNGTFYMGCNSTFRRECEHEQPAHKVNIQNDFYIMKSEVTQSLYTKIIGSNPSLFWNCGKRCPVDSVTWYEAVKFANLLSESEGLEVCYVIDGDIVKWTKGVDCKGWRLPTEAEWEYAAKGGQEYRYSGSDKLKEVGWYSYNSSGSIHEVCLLQKNGFGLCDMSGNALEWVWDWFADYQDSTLTDPLGPETGMYRVLRGGSSYMKASSNRINQRSIYYPNYRDYYNGFRLCRTRN